MPSLSISERVENQSYFYISLPPNLLAHSAPREAFIIISDTSLPAPLKLRSCYIDVLNLQNALSVLSEQSDSKIRWIQPVYTCTQLALAWQLNRTKQEKNGRGVGG